MMPDRKGRRSVTVCRSCPLLTAFLFLLFSWLIVSPSHAQEQFRSGIWRGEAQYADNGDFKRCAMWSRAFGRSVLTFAIGRGSLFEVGVYDKRLHLSEGQQFEAFIGVDRRYRKRVAGTAESANQIWLPLGFWRDKINLLRLGRAIGIQTEFARFAFPLKGTKNGLPKLIRCAKRARESILVQSGGFFNTKQTLPRVFRRTCHMDSCAFEKLLSIKKIGLSRNGSLFQVRALSKGVEAKGIDYERVKVPSFEGAETIVRLVHCSKRKPATLFEGDGQTYVDLINVGHSGSVFGYNLDAHRIYMSICHDWDNYIPYERSHIRHVRRLGYRRVWGQEDLQPRFTSFEAALRFLGVTLLNDDYTDSTTVPRNTAQNASGNAVLEFLEVRRQAAELPTIKFENTKSGTIERGDLRIVADLEQQRDKEDSSLEYWFVRTRIYESGKLVLEFSEPINGPTFPAIVQIAEIDPSNKRPEVYVSIHSGGASGGTSNKIAVFLDNEEKWFIHADAPGGAYSPEKLADIDGDGIFDPIEWDSQPSNSFSDCGARCFVQIPRVKKVQKTQLIDKSQKTKFAPLYRKWLVDFSNAYPNPDNSKLAAFVAVKTILGEQKDAWAFALQRYDRKWIRDECDRDDNYRCKGPMRQIRFPEALKIELERMGLKSDHPVTSSRPGAATATLQARNEGLPTLRQGMKYSKARQLLLDAGWQGIRKHMSEVIGAQIEHVVYELGFFEAQNCAGTGLANCRFKFVDATGRHLIVTSIGETDPVVDRWFFK